MRLVFAGTPQVAVPALEAVAASTRHELVGVITRPDAPSGRGRRLTPSPVAVRATELGVEVLKPERPGEEGTLERLRALAPDACPVVAYGALLPQVALDIPPHGWINLHFSLLPRWRGAAPVQRAIMAGDEYVGTSCFRIVKALDAGPVFETQQRPLPEITAGELLEELAVSGAAQLLRTLDAIEAGATPQAQVEEWVTLAPKLTPAEARIDFGRTAVAVRNHVLGCSPDPGAWAEYEGQRIKILRAAVAEPQEALGVGELQPTKRRVLVGCAEGVLELLEVQLAGKRRMPAVDWARQGISGVLS